MGRMEGRGKGETMEYELVDSNQSLLNNSYMQPGNRASYNREVGERGES